MVIFLDSKASVYDNIIEAALIEFGTKGYLVASTNVIAKNASVSKGLIFKYFSSKANLFYIVFERELNFFLEQYREFKTQLKNDIFEQIIDIVIWKGQYAKRYPNSSNVLLEGIANPPLEIKEQLLGKLITLKEISISDLISGIAFDKTNPEISKETVARVINIAVAGLQATYIDKNTNFEVLESIRSESLEYLKILIRGMEK